MGRHGGFHGEYHDWRHHPHHWGWGERGFLEAEGLALGAGIFTELLQMARQGAFGPGAQRPGLGAGANTEMAQAQLPNTTISNTQTG